MLRQVFWYQKKKKLFGIWSKAAWHSMSFSILALITFWARSFFVEAGEGRVLSTKRLAAPAVSTHWMPGATLTHPQVMSTKNASGHWQQTRRNVHLQGSLSPSDPSGSQFGAPHPPLFSGGGSPPITSLAAKLISILQTPVNWALESRLSPQQNIW